MLRTSKNRLIPWSETTPQVVSAAMSTAPPGYVIPRSWFSHLADFDLWLICEGRVELEEESGGKFSLMRGSAVLLKPGDSFELHVDASGTYTNAYVHFNLLDREGKIIPYERIDMPATLGYVQDTPCFEATLRRIMFLQYQRQSAEPKLRDSIQCLVSHLMKGLLHDYCLTQAFSDSDQGVGLQNHHSQMISTALSWIYLHPETTLSAAKMAEKFGYSQRHFGRIFQQVSGKTPGQALIEAKIDHAKKLLAGSSLNVSEIAASLNYECVFYFSRQFRSVVGMSPLEFRKDRFAKFPSRAGSTA